ncbi:hypothetical protein DV736_g6007, partial [Chaetothyriales sp. CBS 134916]
MATTAASNVPPTLVRSHSSSRNPPSSYGPSSPGSQTISRTRSTNQRPTTSSQHHHRPGSRGYYTQDTPPPSNPGVLANAARRDGDPADAVQPSSRRSSRDGRPDHNRDGSRHGRPSSRPGSRRNSQDMAPTPAPLPNGNSEQPPPPSAASSDKPSQQPYAATGRRRTSIKSPTGTWSLGKTIGQGSMGKVKLAKNMETEEQAAVKIVPRQTVDEQGRARDERADRSKEIRTAREAAMVSLLHHPYICKMIDVQKTNYHWYMLFEYVNGGQMLDYIIAHGRLKEKQARKFGRQIASALDYCHRNSVVHRDLKIENILISKNGDIKIIDFGLSNLFSPRSLLKTFCGSLYFAAPELLQARQYTGPEVDVWSFGIVLYVLVCGKVPFDDQSMPQLHAKIKRGVVEYPAWLTAECKSIISRMLVVDPRERATLQEIMNHPWMTKGFNAPPENLLPPREPLQLPLDPQVIDKMQGFDFGSAKHITEQLTQILTSDEYQAASRRFYREEPSITPSGNEKKRGMFDFYRRRSISREGITSPSAETIRGSDPLNAYSPLISIYFLAREKVEAERKISSTGPGLASGSGEGDLRVKLTGLPSPEAAHTNSFAPELPGEKATGGRSRPRARTHGEDEVVQDRENLTVATARVVQQPISSNVPLPPEQPAKKDGTAMGLLRRFSTRRVRDREVEKPAPPTLNIQPPQDSAAPPRKSFSVRRARRRDPSPATLHAGGSQPLHDGLLTPDGGRSRAGKFLGRSTSVNSADFRPRHLLNAGGTEADSAHLGPEPPQTSGSDHSNASTRKIGKGIELEDKLPPNASPVMAATATKAATTRAKSLGHARQESIQARRRKWEEAKRDRHANVPEETDAELRDRVEGSETPTAAEAPSTEISKPAGLKGLFSTSTTSNKSPEFIRQDLIRVLNQLGVQYTAIKAGFSCRHAPSINLDEVREPIDDDRGGRMSSAQQRRISFGGAFRGKEREDLRDDKVSRLASSRRRYPDQSFVTNSEGSDEYVHSGIRRHEQATAGDAAATRTRVQDDSDERLVLRFEIAIVKIPLLRLHGIQFKKVQGGMNQYRSMTSTILNSLRL